MTLVRTADSGEVDVERGAADNAALPKRKHYSVTRDPNDTLLTQMA